MDASINSKDKWMDVLTISVDVGPDKSFIKKEMQQQRAGMNTSLINDKMQQRSIFHI